MSNVENFVLNTDDIQTDLNKLAESFKSLKQMASQISSDTLETSERLKFELKSRLFRFYTVIDRIDDIVIIKDSQNRWITLNKRGQELFDLTIEDYYNKTDIEIFENCTKCVLSVADDTVTDELGWTSNDHYRKITLYKINGKFRHFDVVKSPVFHEDGTRKELIIIARDVTELKESELRNKACVTALNSASDIIVICDRSGIITFCNNSFLDTFAFTDNKQVQGKTLKIVASGKMPKDFFKNMWTTIRSNNTWTETVINKCQNNQLINCLVTIIPIMNGDPNPIYYICIMKVINNEIDI
jgi:PAS domain S-box-containing protein